MQREWWQEESGAGVRVNERERESTLTYAAR